MIEVLSEARAARKPALSAAQRSRMGRSQRSDKCAEEAPEGGFSEEGLCSKLLARCSKLPSRRDEADGAPNKLIKVASEARAARSRSQRSDKCAEEARDEADGAPKN